jgi:hypothetical protein
MKNAVTLEERDEIVSTLRSTADALVSRSTSYEGSDLEKSLLRMYASVALRVALGLDAPSHGRDLTLEDVQVATRLLQDTIEGFEGIAATKEPASAARLRARIASLRHIVEVLQRHGRIVVPEIEGLAAFVRTPLAPGLLDLYESTSGLGVVAPDR